MSDSIVSLRHVEKWYGNNHVVKDMNLEIQEGEFLTLLGPSGCGKSTLLALIAGIEHPSGGEVLVDGEPVRAPTGKAGLMPQRDQLFDWRTIWGNVTLGLEVRHENTPARRDGVHNLLEQYQLSGFARKLPNQLSGGMRQRCALIRTLATSPDVLLLDEPMSNLDARLKIEIRDEIRRVQQETGITSIIVTHDQEEAMAIADKIAILDNGRIQQYDTPEHLYHYPANLFVAKFMGNPPMNFIDAALSADGTRVEGAGFSLPLEQHMAQGGKKFAGHAVKVGVRSHLMAVHTEKVPQSMEMRLQIAENLGKEILISGMVGDSFVRVTVPENHDTFEQYKAISRSEKPFVYLTMTGVYNIFDTESGVNIALEK